MSENTEGNGSVGTEDRAEPQRGGAAAHEAFARVPPPPPPAPPKRPLYKRPAFLIIAGLIVVGAVVGGLLWWLDARNWESTDDAFVQADVTQVSPRVAGYVNAVYVSDNQDVAQGAKIIDLDPSDYEAKTAEAAAALAAAESGEQQALASVRSAEADVGQAQAAELSAQTEADRAHSELKRFESLSAEAVTQQQLINLRAAAAAADAQLAAAKQKTVSSQVHVKSSQSQVAVAQAQIKQAQASLHEAQLQLDYTKIAAPIAGHVTSKSVQPGNYVQIGQALMALVPHDVYVIANYKETQLDMIKPGQAVDIAVDAFSGHTFHGKVDSIQRGSGAAFSLLPPENATGNYVKVVQRVPVKIVFDSEGYALGPGMSVVPKVRVR